MALLSASNLSQSFGAEDIFAGISLSIPDGGKIGIVGPNGVGKTTLLLILAGREQAASGNIHVAKRTRIGYLDQEAAQSFAGKEHSVYEEAKTVFASLQGQQEKLHQMEAQMEAGDGSEALFDQYGKAVETFEQAGGYDYEVRIKQTLDGLGFDDESRHLPLIHLSGGQKTRALLACLLLKQPDLLILDEPTNHLDIEAVAWLEGTLNKWQGAVLVVSHDRYFLDEVVDYVWEMSHDRMEEYRGNYSHYVTQRQERWDRRQEEFAAFKERVEKELDFVRKHIASQNTSQAKGKLKRLSRELNAAAILGWQAVVGQKWSKTAEMVRLACANPRADWSVAEAATAIGNLRAPSNRPPQLNLHLARSHRSGNVVLRTKDLAVGYPSTPLFESEDIELWRGDCTALIGSNGAGKTTFLRTILGRQEPLAGTYMLGASLKIGYFAQAHEALNPKRQVIDELMHHHPMMVSTARNMLGRYLFRGDDVYKLVGDLSGGERGRLALAVLALEGANFLLLDEPTNHLDITAQEMLQQVLQEYAGTILMVSHDRYLIDRLANQIWHLEDNYLHIFKGGYQAFLKQEEGEQQPVTIVAAEVSITPDTPSPLEKPKLSKNEQRKREQIVAAIEQQIKAAEDGMEQISDALQLAIEGQDFDKVQTLGIEYRELEKSLASLLEEWTIATSE